MSRSGGSKAKPHLGATRANSTQNGAATTSSSSVTMAPRPSAHLTNTRVGREGNPPGLPEDEATRGTQVSSNKLFNINFTQINLKKSKAATGDLSLHILNKENPIILAQEPHVNGKGIISKVSLDMKTVAFRNTKVRPRACIYHHKAMSNQLWPMESLTTKDCAVVQTEVDGKQTIIASCYMDRNDKLCPPQALRNVVIHAKTHKLGLIIGSDVNAHNTAWNSRICDNHAKERGDNLLDFIIANNLFIENVGDTPTFDNGRWTNVIDLTITNQMGHDLVEHWNVEEKIHDKNSSDHNYVTFRSTGVTKLSKPSFRDISKTNWEVYEAELTKNFADSAKSYVNIDSAEKLDKAAEQFSMSVMDAFNSATDLTYVSSKVRPPPWDTPEVKAARRDMRTKLRLAIKNKDKSKTNHLDAIKKESRKNYEKIRNHSWSTKYKEFCNKLEMKSDCKRISSLIKDNKDTRLGTIRKPDGRLSESPSETLDVMTEVHFGDNTEDPDPPATSSSAHVPVDSTGSPWTLDHIFSENRVRRALQEFSPLTAAGPDGIKPIMLQKGWDVLKDAFINVSKASFRLSHTPEQWRNSTGIFLPKPGKADYYKPKSYRTITLCPVPLKWMERIILWHMEVDLKVYSKISKKQFGFKRGYSTTAAVHKIVRSLEMAILNKGMALGTFLDIEGAFDNVSFYAIKRALNLNCSSSAVNQWIMSMIHNRKITVELQGSKKEIPIKRGCPQGGILSPFLWNLVINELFDYTRNRIPNDLQGFADDLALVSIVTAPKRPDGTTQGFDADTLREVTQKSLNSINQWCKQCGLKLSQLKTHCVMFTNRRNWSFSMPLKVDGNEIEMKQSTKFLGLTLDSKLLWNDHIEDVCKKSKGILMQCRKAVGPTWGFRPATMRWIYEAVVRPMISYGSNIWINGTLKHHNAQLLNGVQRLANVLITGAMPSTPGVALDKITGTIPIKLWLEEAAAKETLRLKSLGHWQHPPPGKPSVRLTSHIQTNDKLLKCVPKDIISGSQDQCIPVLCIDQGFTVDIPSRDGFCEPKESEYDVTCYTDGSKLNELVGAGIVVKSNLQGYNLDHTEAFHLGQYSTVFQAEIVAIEKVTTYLLGHSLEGKKILINCDSKSAINAIDSTVIRNNSTLTATTALNSLGRSNEVTLRWIPAHCGYEGNELADLTAKRGANNNNATNFMLPIPRCIRFAALRSRTKASWSESFKNDSPRLFSILWREKFTKELIKMKGKDLRVATQLLTGHAALNYHLNKLHCIAKPTCPLCEADDETVSHFLGQCPMLGNLRADLFNTYYATASDIVDRYSLAQIVKYANRSKRLEPCSS